MTPTRRPSTRKPPPTSADLRSIKTELDFAGDRPTIQRICIEVAEALEAVTLSDEHRAYIEIGRAPKKNFAQRLSTALAQKLANALRPEFAGINPDALGAKHESKSRGATGLKKLDVNYSTTQAGLGLAISVKTINFKDEKTKRYTKNIKRVDGELRAEAQDCHTRQPYAVLVALVLLPEDAASDGESVSSLKHGWNVFKHRGGRKNENGEAALFELVFLGTYSASGELAIFEISLEPPERGLPTATHDLATVVSAATGMYKQRNRI
jgi:hypothetical protein